MQIHFKGHFCNDWPYLELIYNNNLVYDGQLKGEKIFDLDLLGNHDLIVLRHKNKRFGANRIWDTRSDTQGIIQDRRLELLDISIAGISFKHKCHRLRFHQEATVGEPLAPTQWEGDINFNGRVELDIIPSPLSWLTLLLHKQDKQEGVSYFSDHTNLFHYEEDVELIREIKSMLGSDEIQ